MKNKYKDAIRNLLQFPPPKKFCQCHSHHRQNKEGLKPSHIMSRNIPPSSRQSDSGNDSQDSDPDKPFWDSSSDISAKMYYDEQMLKKM
jgi:hypothetical protein